MVQEAPVQILEVRGAEGARPVTITLTVTADAGHAMFVALSEELDRRRLEETTSAEDVLALREQMELVERFEPLAAAAAGAIVGLSQPELHGCLLALSRYADRVDQDHFQPPDMRERLQVIAGITPVLWDANAAATEAADVDEPLTQTGA